MCTAPHTELLLISLKISRTVPSAGMELCRLLRAETFFSLQNFPHPLLSGFPLVFLCPWVTSQLLSAYTEPRCRRRCCDVEHETQGICWIKTVFKHFLFVDFLKKISRLFFFSSLTFCNDSSHLQISLVCRVCVCFPLMARPERCFQIDFFLSWRVRCQLGTRGLLWGSQGRN